MNSTASRVEALNFLEEIVYIYALFFGDDVSTCYIGQTNNLAARHRQHQFKSTLRKKSLKNNWIKCNLDLNKELQVQVIAKSTSRAEANELEAYWIKQFKLAGLRLKNSTDGGDGIVGLRRTPEHRQKISQSIKRIRRMHPELFPKPTSWPGILFYNANRHLYPRTEKQIEQWNKVLEASRGRPLSGKRLERLVALNRRRWIGKSKKERMAASRHLQEYAVEHGRPLTGTKNSPETIAKRVEGLSKRYHLISPSGERVDVVNMAEFARQHGLDKRNLHSLTTGKQKSHRGWKLDTTMPQGYKDSKRSKIAVQPLTDAMVEEAWNV